MSDYPSGYNKLHLKFSDSNKYYYFLHRELKDTVACGMQWMLLYSKSMKNQEALKNFPACETVQCVQLEHRGWYVLRILLSCSRIVGYISLK